MIELKDVSFRYEGSETKALQEVSLRVAKGECLVLTGDSGCGKTTVTRLINGLIPGFYPGELRGCVKIDGKEIAGKEPHELSSCIGSVFQNPRTQFFTTDTDSELVFGMENSALPYEEMHRRYERTVLDLQLQKLCGRDIFALSGGEKQSIAFGSIYALSPEIYVLDEPSANLDKSSILRLQDILLHLKHSGKTLLISEHRLYYLQGVADRLIILGEGRLRESFLWEELEKMPRQTLREKGLRSLRDPELRILPPSCPARIPALEIRRLSLLRKEKPLLENLSFMAEAGEILGITGPNGIGKTTLARTICGLFRESRGEIFFSGERADALARKRRAFLVMQDPNYQLFSDSVENELTLRISGEAPSREKILSLLSSLRLEHLVKRHPLSLSGGQKQRLCIALAALSEAEIILFDEPTSGLDYRNMRRAAEMIRNLAKRQKALILISHDSEFLNLACTRIISLSR